MTTASDICDAIGRKKLASELDVGVTAVSNAAVAGRFPPSWYKVVRALSKTANVQCPDSLFTWKERACERARAAE